MLGVGTAVKIGRLELSLHLEVPSLSNTTTNVLRCSHNHWDDCVEPRKWLKVVDKAGLLNLLWVLHYNRTPIIVLVIKKLLCLGHDGCLWLEEPIPIIDRLIHRITQLPYIGENLAMMFGGKGGE